MPSPPSRVPIHEPGLEALIATHWQRLTFTLDLEVLVAASDILIVAVDTPPSYSGDADLSRVMAVVDELGAVGGDPRHILAMKSTVPVGTGERVRRQLDARGLPAGRIRVEPRVPQGGHRRSPTSCIPTASWSGPSAPRTPSAWPRCTRRSARRCWSTSVPTAEMVKYASNAFLATKISFINEIANVCEETGADVAVVADGMGMDPRIGASFLRPGIGFGGSCFPKDVAALKQLAGNSGYHFQLLTSVIEVNELQKRRVIGKLKKHLGDIRGRRIALLGLAFKPGTDDMREAASLVLAGRLLAEGAQVVGWDPVVRDLNGLAGVEIAASPQAALAGADACVIVTEWPEIVGLDWPGLTETMQHPVVIDGRNALDPVAMTRAGFRYEGIGRLPDAMLGAGERE